MRKVIFIYCLILLSVPFLFADETKEETLARILKEAVSISVHSQIVLQGNDKYWESDITKVTIPGRAVTLLFETESEKLSIELTPFKSESDDGVSYTLTAVSQFWHEDSEGVQFRSSFKSISLLPGELILFYPLGLKTQEVLSGGNLHMEMGIRIEPYRTEKEEQTD
ncbi:hypothetical protein [Spirochaeta isovalerica]|uniref:Lipoprotein n=1 Tax=Spirochaeta isovalerica TaxID=150 RepID=A0A841R5J6_9SPIO|nr:hypothetical protein [Spirochaeta isovalerica]MBB6478427.1 hypothetical protein [Spirochaeta isovalerica]